MGCGDTKVIREALALAVQETLEAFGGTVEPDEEGNPADLLKASSDRPAVIRVQGGLCGAFVFCFSAEAAGAITELLLAEPGEPGSDLRHDALGEVLNMVVGALKRKLSDSPEFFAMGVPGEDSSPPSDWVGRPGLWLTFRLRGEFPLSVGLVEA